MTTNDSQRVVPGEAIFDCPACHGAGYEVEQVCCGKLGEQCCGDPDVRQVPCASCVTVARDVLARLRSDSETLQRLIVLHPDARESMQADADAAKAALRSPPVAPPAAAQERVSCWRLLTPVGPQAWIDGLPPTRNDAEMEAEKRLGWSVELAYSRPPAQTQGDGERSVLYYECHITIEPVLEDDRRAILEATIKPYGFRLAELLFQRHRADTPERSAKDSFTTARGDNFDELANRMHLCRHALMAAGFEVWRYKIEAALVDCRRAAIDAARDG